MLLQMADGFLLPHSEYAGEKLLFHALNVSAGSGIDFDQIALVAKQRHTHFGAGFHRGGFKGIGCRIAAQTGFGIGDGEYYGLREFYGKHNFLLGVEKHVYRVAFFQKLTIINHFTRNRNLVVRFLVHEHIVVAVGVEVLKFAALNTNVGDGVATLKGVFDHLAGRGAFKLGPNFATAAAHLKLLKINDFQDIVVEFDAQAVANVCSRCHVVVLGLFKKTL